MEHYEYQNWDFISIYCTKRKFSIKDFFSKCDQIRRKLRIWSHLLKKSLMENLIFCAMTYLLSLVSAWYLNTTHLLS